MTAGADATPLPVDFDAAPRRAIFVMLASLALFAVLAVAWTAWARLDVAVQAQGAVVAAGRLQEVQSLEGGIVREVRVAAGQAVRRGDVLVRLDRAQYDADLGEGRQQMLALSAARVRIDALLAGTEPRFGALAQEAPDVVREQHRLWREARAEQQAAQAAAAEGVRQRAAELAETHGRIAALQPAVEVAREAYEIERQLAESGAGAKADLLAARQRLLAQEADLGALRAALPRLEAALAGARASAQESLTRARTQWGEQRAELEAKAAALAQGLAGREDKLARRELLAPMDGIVNRVLIPTAGGVAAPGAAILQIVPVESGLRIDVRVPPADIGFLHAGQPATVRIAAYDPSIYGTLEATLERVGADTLLDDNKQPYFEVQLRTREDHLLHEGRRLAVSPGMSADVSILTGRRTVLQYLLKPVLKTLDQAMTER